MGCGVEGKRSYRGDFSLFRSSAFLVARFYAVLSRELDLFPTDVHVKIDIFIVSLDFVILQCLGSCRSELCGT